ncbi:ataxin-2 [Erpetoichthys calabaricus]|uniref:ataxin-2 n=1 Tax=Erpetoichthys calabaricus TaxID=27687 RepID=UPI00109F3F3C|nr:ataxin-2 [Erpetoichthys calabaricus]
MSMKQAGGTRKPGGSGGPSAASGAGGSGGRQSLARGRNSGKGPPSASIPFDGVYANMRMVHVLTSVVGTKCELKVKNGIVYEGVFKTYSPKCDLVLDAVHRKCLDSALGPKREDIVESIIFKASDVVVVQFKDVDLNYARKVSSETDTFTDSAINARINGEHKEKDLEPWDSGEMASEDLEALETDVSNGWDPNDMFKFNEENYGVKSTYDSSLSSYTVPLERDNSEEFLKREARAAQLAEEIESSAVYKARVALENDDRTEEEKYTAVTRSTEREGHIGSLRDKYVPPGQRNRDGMSWASVRQSSPRMTQPSSVSAPPRAVTHNSEYSPSSGVEQRVVNGGVPWPSPCPSPSSRPPSRYQSGPTSLPPLAATPTRPPSRPSRPPSHPSAHGSPAPVSAMPKRMSTEGPPRMSPKTQRTPRGHRVSTGRSGVSSSVEFMSHTATAEMSAAPAARTSPSGGTWSSVVSGSSSSRLSPKAHRPKSPRQNSVGSASSGSSLPSPQVGTIPAEPVAMPVSSASPTTTSPALNRTITPSVEAKESRLQEPRQNSPTSGRDNLKTNEASPNFSKPVTKAVPCMAPDHRKQIDNLKKFSVDFRLQPSSTPDPVFDQMISKPRDPPEKLKDSQSEKSESLSKELLIEDNSASNTTGGSSGGSSSSSSSKPSSPSTPPSTLCTLEQRKGPDVTSQGVQTSGPGSKHDKDDKEEKADTTPEQVRKSTLNPNAKEFNPRTFCTQPKPASTPTPPRPQSQQSPSIVVQQHPTVYSQTVCFPQMYPLPVSPGVQQTAMYHVPVAHMPVNQTKPYRAGKVPNMPQQRPDQHHPQGTTAMMHPVSAAGPPIVTPNPAYSAQYVTYNPQQFASQPLVQQVPHYQSQPPHVYSPVLQSGARMMAPPTHGQPGLVSSSTTQYGAADQTHAMYVSPGPIPQQYTHPSAALHHHPQHPQPSATPTGQQQQQQTPHPASHPAPSPVQHAQHQAAQAIHLGNPQQQPLYSTLTPTPPSMTPGPNPQSPQTSFTTAAPAVYIHPQQVQHGYNTSHMAHVPQAHVQSGMVPPHHATPTHPPMMLMATQPPGGPQPPIPQSALPPIPVSSTTHFSYMAHPSVQTHHQPQL